ncbi:alpha/beta fold hydrolase [Ramlibacter sp. AW1]|uniref:Alpha/beta fold hydrolase n=1 Tax=Ramlibacter aurantiacus TaxID=2801330 RepID=A0A936ZUM6_9BURK|nr:alpha/beta fold hydrolase [Ramlibacter aurantiacus]MBL0422891.1 alpha/beta fold hydrolase [Ramlibacter aurantiacus]
MSLACRIQGPVDAPAVVLLHAIATHGAIWQAQAAVWSRRLRVACIDLPGHGDSADPDGPLTLADYARQVADTMDAHGIADAALVGLSLGGMVAQAFALDHPASTRALVLAHTSARTDAAVRELWSARLAQAEADGLAAQVAPTLARWFTRGFAAASPLTLQGVAAQIRRTSLPGYAAAVGAIQALDHLERLPSLRVPTLVVAGARDSAVPPAVARQLAEAIPDARLLVLPDAAHLGPVEQPVVFTESVGAFLLEVMASGISRA